VTSLLRRGAQGTVACLLMLLALGASGTAKPRDHAASGGTLSVYQSLGYEHLDPGSAYFQLDYPIVYATQTPLFTDVPNSTSRIVPDLAARPAAVSRGGTVVTVHIRRGVHFSPPVNREVTSADVAYAIERGARANVENGYFLGYFGHIVGARNARGGPIRGISTPNRYRIVFHLDGPYATVFIEALTLPLSSPVPREFVARLDRHRPTTFGLLYDVATGPYMIRADRHGRIAGVGYTRRTLTLVRNPNWRRRGDPRPAHLDRIVVHFLSPSLTRIGLKVLRGSHAVEGDAPSASVLRTAYLHHRRQLEINREAGNYFVSMDNHRGPFSNVNVRRALWAGLDRNAMLLARGGRLVNQLGTHFIYPGIPGYAAAGGARGPMYDFNRHPGGDLALARAYMRRAGFRNARYSGHQVLSVVASNFQPSPSLARIVVRTLHRLGFRTHLRLVNQAVLYARYCGVPSREIDVCPDGGWIADFADAETVLEPLFAGYDIVPVNDSNWSHVNDPQINRAMRRASRTLGVAARARAWARIDRMLVARAVAVPWAFAYAANIESADVHGVPDKWNAGVWDYSYTSLR
jgi:peptide/nickel transport system substrate-binding protein